MSRKTLTPAIAYLRTSSAANVGEDKDSQKRQLAAITTYAKRAGYEIVDTYYDADVKGSDPVDQRPGFSAMMERLLSNGVKTVIVETANRFARDLMVQEVGFAMMKSRGLTLIAADSPDSFVDETPTAVMIRQILGSVAQFEKTMVVTKLRGARDRKSKAAGKRIEGRKGVETRYPEATARAKALKRLYVTMSLRDLAAKLAEEGHMAAEVKAVEGVREGRPARPFTPEVVKAMLAA